MKTSLKQIVFLALILCLAGVNAWAQLRPNVLEIHKRNNQVIVNWDERTSPGVLQTAIDPAGPWQIVRGATAPYSTFPTGAHRYYRLGPGPGTGPRGSGTDGFIARSESDLGDWFIHVGNDWMFTAGTQWSRIRSGVGRADPLSPTVEGHSFKSVSGSFLAEQDNTPVAIFFSAEAYVDGNDKRLFLRALVDGKPVNPGDVVFVTGTAKPVKETRSFVFTANVDRGLHTVEFEWLIDEEGTGYIRDAAFLVRKSDSPGRDGSVRVFTPPSGPGPATTVDAWQDVPGLGGSIETEEGDSLAISVSAESYCMADGTLFVRALVDGQPADPSDVLFAKGSKPQCRLMTFGIPTPTPGVHTVQIQWRVGGGVGFVGDRSLVLMASPKLDSSMAQVFKAPASGPALTTSSTSFVPMPNMSVKGALPANGELAVLLSAVSSVFGNDTLHVRMNVDGNTVSESEVQLQQGSTHTGVHSHIFSAKHLYPDGAPETSVIEFEWKVQNGSVVSLDDRSLTILVKRASVPDLAEPLLFGGGNTPIDVAIGPRKLLTILWDPKRPGHPALPVNGVRENVFGNTESIRDYYEVVSNGRFTLENALGGTDILSYDALEDWTNYFDDDPGCEDHKPATTPNGQDRRRREALVLAAADIDFAALDLNKDGVLSPQTELGILLVIPDFDGTGSKYRKVYDLDCGPLEVDGVVIPWIAEWMTTLAPDKYVVGAHELAHHYLNLDDIYVLNSPITTGAGRFSLMEAQVANHAAHLSALEKLALGWVDASVVDTDGIYSLQDVKLSHEILILPRVKGSKKDDEYYLLENRQSAANSLLYDKNLLDSGIAVWHIVEGHDDNGIAPVCENSWASTKEGNARRGNRLIRPQISKSGDSLWSSDHYDLLDTGLVCPGPGISVNERRNIVQWADGTPSGYSINNWSAVAETMSFQIVTP